MWQELCSQQESNVRNKFPALKESTLLAELVGVILGDGGITKDQLRISLDKDKDRDYACHVRNLCQEVLGAAPSWYEYDTSNVITLCITGVSLVEELRKKGLKQGNKIVQDVSFPSWLWKKTNYFRACARGLFDTDGCLYFHRHKTGTLEYRHLGLCFTSLSEPLLESFSQVLKSSEINHSKTKERIYIYSFDEIKRFLKDIGSNNAKHLRKYTYHLSKSTRLS